MWLENQEESQLLAPISNDISLVKDDMKWKIFLALNNNTSREEWYYINDKWEIVYRWDFGRYIVLEWVDISSFQLLDWENWIVAKDTNFAYYDWFKMLVDIETFQYIWEGISIDKNNVYYCQNKINWVVPKDLPNISLVNGDVLLNWKVLN